MAAPAREKSPFRVHGFALTACLLSLALHLLLFQLAGKLPLSGPVADSLLEKTGRPPLPQRLRLLREKPEPVPVPEEGSTPEGWLDLSQLEVPEFQDLAQEASPGQEVLRQKTEEVRALLEEHALQEAPVELFQLQQPSLPPPPEMMAAPTGALAFPQEALQMTSPSPEILSVKAEDLPVGRLEESLRPVLPDWQREFVPPEIPLPSLADPGALAGPPPAAVTSALSLQSMRPSFRLSDEDLQALLGTEGGMPAARPVPPSAPNVMRISWSSAVLSFRPARFMMSTAAFCLRYQRFCGSVTSFIRPTCVRTASVWASSSLAIAMSWTWFSPSM